MLEHTFVRTSVIARLRGGPLGPYLDDLATALHHAGYAPSSTQRYLRAAEQCTQWLQEQGYAVNEMDGDLVQRYVSGLTRSRSGKLPRLLLDSRVVDVSMAYNPTFATLSSVKPLFFNGLQNA